MAGSDRLYDGVFRQSGIVRARSMVELFDFCAVLARCPPVPGRRVAIQTHSGGPGASAADACGREGLTLSDISDQTLKNMRAFVPHTGSLSNPVDLTFSKNIMEFFDNIPDLLLADPNVDGLLIYLLLSQRTMKPVLSQMGVAPEDIEAQAEQITAHVAQALSVLPQRHAKPLIGFSYRSDHPLFKSLRDAGIPVLPSPESAARAMAALVTYRELTAKLARSAALTHPGQVPG
jgi:acyl-CoA synthetase (NDP forming)